MEKKRFRQKRGRRFSKRSPRFGSWTCCALCFWFCFLRWFCACRIRCAVTVAGAGEIERAAEGLIRLDCRPCQVRSPVQSVVGVDAVPVDGEGMVRSVAGITWKSEPGSNPSQPGMRLRPVWRRARASVDMSAGAGRLAGRFASATLLTGCRWPAGVPAHRL